jgi:hypothetical protein
MKIAPVPYHNYPTHFQFHEPSRQEKNQFEVFTEYIISPCRVRTWSRLARGSEVEVTELIHLKWASTLIKFKFIENKTIPVGNAF